VKAKYENKKVLDVAYTIIFTSMSILLYTQADIWILGMFTSTESVGIYGIAAKLVILVYFPMVAFGAVIPSLISSIHFSGDLQELRRVVRESTRWILSIAMPIILILLLEGNYILHYCYGAEFEAGYIVLVILTIGQMIKAGSGMVGILFQMTGGHKIYMKVNIIWGILNVALNLLLIPRYGMLGAAGATAVCLSMVDVISIYLIYKRLEVITLAKGLMFDIVFMALVAAAYGLLKYIDLQVGLHVLLFVSLTVYLLKSVYNHDIPWQLLFGKVANK
jgi:O-antigen/teichoic acid export membrane protein